MLGLSWLCCGTGAPAQYPDTAMTIAANTILAVMFFISSLPFPELPLFRSGLCPCPGDLLSAYDSVIAPVLAIHNATTATSGLCSAQVTSVENPSFDSTGT